MVNHGPPFPRTWWGFLLWLILLGLLSHVLTWLAAGESVKLAWNANPEPDIAGYRVNYGADNLETAHEAGNVTSTTIDGLEPGATYQFVLRAVNASGLESDPAGPISYTVPEAPAGPYSIEASTEETAAEDGRAGNAIDGKPETFWHSRWSLNGVPGPEFWQTDWQSDAAPPPHSLTITWPEPVAFQGVRYLPRQDGESNGNLTAYNLAGSVDGVEWATIIEGTLESGAAERVILGKATGIRHARLTWKGDPFGCAAELVPLYTAVPMVKYELLASPDMEGEVIHTFERPFGQRDFFWLRMTFPSGHETTLPMKP